MGGSSKESKPVGYGDELLRLAVEASPAGMLAVDATGRIVLVNREIERLFGYTREELLGAPIETLVPERFSAAHPSYRASYARDAKARPMGMSRDLYGRRKDGSEVPVEIGLSPVPTANGAVVLASVVDISARRRVEDQLRQSQKMEAIGTLAGGIAHDFNNILLAIVGYTELAQQARPGDPQHAADLDQVLAAAERGRQLVLRILTFSRSQRLTRSPVEPARIVRETIQLLRASLPKTIAIVEEIDAHAPPLLADETQLQQVLMNLVTNAAHAMPNGGTLRVVVDPFDIDSRIASAVPGLVPGPHVRLSVVDTGVGMSEEVRARVFEPFFTTRSSGTGTGLGLAVTLGIVQSHGGAVEVESTPGVGTRVDVYLPSAERISVVDAPASEPCHVLLVDDEPMLATMLKRQLESEGYRVSVHTSSVEALHVFKRAPEAFDLLITDNTMPQLTGLALTREIVNLRPDIPVLLISGIIETVEPSALYEHGVTKWLPKPHTLRQLTEAVEELIGKGRGDSQSSSA